jgi:hypothetical protein
MNWLEKAYTWFWYHLESLWIKAKATRRPFTFMMRDFMIQHPTWAAIIVLVELTLLCWLNLWNRWAGFWLGAFYFALFAHLVWGTPMKENEQEYPQYIEQEH